MPTIYIIRGLPGSGKSTLGNTLLKAKIVDKVCEADHYMINGSGEYVFDQNRLMECHSRCQTDTRAALQSGLNVAVCNTFTKIWEMEFYLEIAKDNRYTLAVIKCEGNYGSVHGVPKSKINEMRSRFQDWPREFE
ncbi:MAG: AAA family ATPase [Roseovarius sp.]|nr:AAA family ATPase [Roseovarius sp.]